jgi:RNA polymerase sigma factor (sigma-70 family)
VRLPGARDPLRDPGALIPRVYAYVAYRLGDGPDAEDVTSDVFERALRYRGSYDPDRGSPLAWLLGIARRSIEDARSGRRLVLLAADPPEVRAPGELEGDAVRRLTVAAAVGRLDEHDRELVALRYGADLTAREIGELLDMSTNAVEVALHRALARLRPMLERERAASEAPGAARLPRGATSAG